MMRGASPEEILGKQPSSLMAWTKADAMPRGDDSRDRASDGETVTQGASVRMPEPREEMMWLGSWSWRTAEVKSIGG